MTTLAPMDLRDFPPVEANIDRPETLSQTLLAKHNNCPRSAYLSRKYRGGTGSHQMDRGIAVHETLERATNMMIEMQEPVIPGEMCRELADAVMAEHPELVLSTYEQDAARLMAWNWAEATVLDLDTIIGTEIPLEMEVGGFKLTCRIDRAHVYGTGLFLYDYKTSLNIRKREEVQRGFQGQFYGLAALNGVRQDTGLSIGAGITDVWFYEAYPRYRDKESGALVAPEGVWSRSELGEFRVSLERNVAAFERSLETGDWPARDGSWCSECPAAAECPIPEHLRSVPSVDSLSAAEDAFSHKLALERENRRLQDGLRGWVKENGPIFVGDYAFDVTQTQSKSVKDWPTLEAAIQKSVLFGEPFKAEEHITLKQATKFAKRKITEEERDAS